MGGPLRFTGTLGASAAGRPVEIQLLAADGSWRRATSVRAGAGGGFTAEWRSTQAGRFTARAVPGSGAVAARAGTPPIAAVTVYRPATATWYDLSGRRGACGVMLRKITIGVAHKTLPCGTRVDVTYRGRTVTAPVVDRGPYSRGVSYDVTIAVARALGMVEVGRARVGVLSQGERMPTGLPPLPPPVAEGGGVTFAK